MIFTLIGPLNSKPCILFAYFYRPFPPSQVCSPLREYTFCVFLFVPLSIFLFHSFISPRKQLINAPSQTDSKPYLRPSPTAVYNSCHVSPRNGLEGQEFPNAPSNSAPKHAAGRSWHWQNGSNYRAPFLLERHALQIAPESEQNSF